MDLECNCNCDTEEYSGKPCGGWSSKMVLGPSCSHDGVPPGSLASSPMRFEGLRALKMWMPWVAGSFKMNVDASCNGEGCIDMGFVIRDAAGEIYACGGRVERIDCSIAIAEALSLRLP
ncbi:hypothetical protein Ancab_000263 [Ancistrocladus abbreviatus]